jgi:signal transduction histidine kinase
MKRREAMLALFAAGLVALALLTVFAIELSNTQAKSKQDVEARVHERAVLAGALIDSLLQAAVKQLPQEERTYGGRTVSAATLNRNNGQSGAAYTVLLDSAGRVLAHSSGFTAQARANIAHSAALAMIRSGRLYALGNLQPYGSTGALDFAVALRTRYGPRILVSASKPNNLQGFLTGDLLKIPGVSGSHNYVLDANNTVLASTNPRIPVGHVFGTAAERAALGKRSGDVKGRYYDQDALTNSTWRIVLTAPNGPLFASISGARKWIPWAIFVAFASVALVALLLARRLARADDAVRAANDRLEGLNTELAVANAALERRAAELGRSNAELEQFASIASHDLQEPLRKVRTFTQQVTVIESGNLTDKGRDYLERANNAAERMQKLIEDLLKYSRVATHGRPFTDVDLTELCDEVLDDLGAQIEHAGASIEVGELPTISGDALQLRQLLQNLISNAVKFHRPDVTPEIKIHASDDEEQIQLTVSDNGIGFDPQYSRRIFRVFERLHGRGEYPGTGIGLALCRKIAERHGGTVVADGMPAAGATFTVTLPRHLPEEIVVSAQPSAEWAEQHVAA